MKDFDPIESRKNESPESFHKSVLQNWNSIYNVGAAQKIQKFVDTNILDAMGPNSHTLYMIFDGSQMEFVHIGKNVQSFIGYSEEEVTKHRFRFLFRILKFKQLFFFTEIIKLNHYLKNKVPNAAHQAFFGLSVCGLVLRHKNGHGIKVLCRGYPIEIDLDVGLNLHLYEVRNVTSLLKTDDFWLRSISGADREHKYCFTSFDRGRPSSIDLISDCELEVLKLIAEGRQSSEIATMLFISTNTVEKHRKNMIARLGARDTVALTEICKMTGIL